MLMKPINKKQGQNQPPHFTSLPFVFSFTKIKPEIKAKFKNK